MKYLDSFHQTLKKQYPDNWELVFQDIDEAYTTISKDIIFCSTSKNPLDKRLDFSAYFLALIQVLERQDTSFEKIRKVCLEIVSDYVKPKNLFQKWLKKLPPKLIKTKFGNTIIRIMDKKIRNIGHPDGFVARIITDQQKTYGLGYGIDILECGICKLFKKHNEQKYVSILCEIDKITSGLAGLELIRTGTIANGSLKCDFRFKRLSK